MIDNWRWADVPFYLRTGKALRGKQTEVAIKFKQAPIAMFRDTPVDRLAENFLVSAFSRTNASVSNSTPRFRDLRSPSAA